MKTSQITRRIISSSQFPPYEQKRRGLIGWLRMRILKLLALLPLKMAQNVFLAFSGENGDTITVFKNVTKWKALEVLYTYPERRKKGKISLTDKFWQNFLDNARSIRNRLILVKKELNLAIQETSKDKELIHILSIGSGSARSVLETVSSYNGEFPNLQLKVMLIDMDPTAVEFSGILARKFNINGYATKLTGNFFRLERDAANFDPEIVELVGLLDYLTDKQATVLLSKVFRILAPKGYVITGNITPNIEVPFITKGVNWPMIYRTPKELQNLLEKAGFSFENIRIKEEPLGIHLTAIAQKLSNP